MRNFSYQFYCRVGKVKNGTAPLELSVSIERKRVFITLPYRCEPSVFNRKRKPQDVERYLDAQRTLIQKILLGAAEAGENLTAASFKEYFRAGGFIKKVYTADCLFQDYLDIQKKRIGNGITLPAYKKYEYVRNLFFKFFDKNQEVNQINNAVVRSFFAEIDKKFQNATACGYKVKFRAFIRFGLDNALIKINPLQGIKVTKIAKPITYLTDEEVEKLKNAQLNNACLERVRDCAIFQINCGLAFTDAVSLQPEDLQEKDGVYFFNKRRNKTGNAFLAPLLPDGFEVWKKYEGKLPWISNQKYNLFLKALALQAGVEKRCHSHLFRHTYACRLLNSGLSMKATSRCLGDTLKVTDSFYAHLHDETIFSEVKKII